MNDSPLVGENLLDYVCKPKSIVCPKCHGTGLGVFDGTHQFPCWPCNGVGMGVKSWRLNESWKPK